MNMTRQRGLLVSALAVLAAFCLTAALTVGFRKAGYAEGAAAYGSVAPVDGSFEDGEIDSAVIYAGGVKTGGETISVTEEKARQGTRSAKFAGRTGNSTFVVAVSDIELGEEYVFSAYVLADTAASVNAQAVVWAEYDNGQLWCGAFGAASETQADVWKEVRAEFRFYVEGGKLYAVCDGGAPQLAEDHAVTQGQKPSAFRNLRVVEFEIRAPESLGTYYVDDVCVYKKSAPQGVLPLNDNSAMELNTTFGYAVNDNGGTGSIEISSEKAYTGASSLKFTRTGRSQAYYQIAGLELGKEYRFALWANSPVGTWANLCVTPWAVNQSGNPIWGDMLSPGFLLVADRWTKLYFTFRLESDADGKLWVVDCGSGNRVQILNWANREDVSAFDYLQAVDLKLDAMDNATQIYVDDFVVYDTEKPYNEDGRFGDDSQKYNFFINGDMEYGNIREYGTWSDGTDDGIAAEASDERAHSGTYSIKATRTAANQQVYQTLPSSVLKYDEWYRFSVYVWSDKTVAANLIVTPWASGKETGAMIWTDFAGDSKLVPENTWTRLELRFKLGLTVGSRLYIHDGRAKSYAKNWADAGDITCKEFLNAQFKVVADEPGTIYYDDFRLTCDYEVNIPEPPTGHGGNDDTSLYIQMFSNASFEQDLFLTTGSPNGAVWFCYPPAFVRRNADYSHGGDYSAQVYNRTTAKGEFMVNMNTVRIGRTYTYTIYLSSLQETRAASAIEMWGYEQGEGGKNARDPSVYHAGEFKTVKPGEWTAFELTFRYEEEPGDRLTDLVLYVNDERIGVAEDCTGLSCFTFGFHTDDQDANYLTTMYLDSAVLKDVTPENGGDDGGDDDGGGGNVDIGGGDKEQPGGCGCGSGKASAAGAGLGAAFLGIIFIAARRRLR